MIFNTEGRALAQLCSLSVPDAARILMDLSCVVALGGTGYPDEMFATMEQIERDWGPEGLFFASCASVMTVHPGCGYKVAGISIHVLSRDGVEAVEVDDLPPFHRLSIWFVRKVLDGEYGDAHSVWQLIFNGGDAYRLFGILVRAVHEHLDHHD